VARGSEEATKAVKRKPTNAVSKTVVDRAVNRTVNRAVNRTVDRPQSCSNDDHVLNGWDG
jgi:hypothetical protein